MHAVYTRKALIHEKVHGQRRPGVLFPTFKDVKVKG